MTLALSICYTLFFILIVYIPRLTLSLCYLIFPLILFVGGWLHWYLAIPFVTIIIYFLRTLVQAEPTAVAEPITWRLIIACGLLIAWAHISGAGGFGFQSVDYLMHNGRLQDLITYSWPVSYEQVYHDWPFTYDDHNNLVFYLSYYLPAALVGKVSGYYTATLALYLWMVMGLFIVFGWLMSFSKTRLLPFLAAITILFGGWDVVAGLINGDSLPVLFDSRGLSIQRMDIWSLSMLKTTYLWLYPSNTFQLFYAPHQAIAGWIIISLQSYLFFQKKYNTFFFVTSFYAFWSPMMLLMMIPLSIWMVFFIDKKDISHFFSFENIVGGGIITALFTCFYLSGSALSITSGFIWNNQDAIVNFTKIPFLYIVPCGAYSLLLLFFGKKYFSQQEYNWVKIILLTLISALAYFYGEYNDFMLRGVAPLMFVVLFSLVILLHHFVKDKRYYMAWAVILMLLPGMGSSVVLIKRSLIHYDLKRDAVGVNAYFPFNYEQLGQENSFFFKYLAKDH